MRVTCAEPPLLTHTMGCVIVRIFTACGTEPSVALKLVVYLIQWLLDCYFTYSWCFDSKGLYGVEWDGKMIVPYFKYDSDIRPEALRKATKYPQ